MKLLCKILLAMLVTITAQAEETWVWVGDVKVPESMIVSEGVDAEGTKKSGVRLWKDGIIRYRFANNVSHYRRQLFLQSCLEMGEFANVQCLPRRAQDSDYVYVQHTNNNVCGSSYLGRYGGAQPLKINCWRSRTIQHELMHALGVSHEHNRMDRDQYITIVWENISPSLHSNYRKLSGGQTSHLLSYYDYDSIMHYGSRSGSANGGVVMYRRDLGPQNGYISQTNVMSYGDHYFLYALYGGVKP